SAWSAARAFRARCWSTTVVCASPTASTVMIASAVTAATSATPRSPRRNTHQLHELARRARRVRPDAHAHLAQRGMRRAGDVAREAEAVGTRAVHVTGLRGTDLRVGEEGTCEEHGAARVPVRG